MNLMYTSLMEDEVPAEQKYENKRRQIKQNLKSETYWPQGMKHPEDYRGFYWTNDMAFCGFATLSHQEKTVGMIKKALDSKKPTMKPPTVNKKFMKRQHAAKTKI